MKLILLVVLLLSCNDENMWLESFVNSTEFKTIIKGIDFDSEVIIYLEDNIEIDLNNTDFTIIKFKEKEYNFYSRSFQEKNKNSIVIVRNNNYERAWSFYRPYSGSVIIYVLDDKFKIKEIDYGAI